MSIMSLGSNTSRTNRSQQGNQDDTEVLRTRAPWSKLHENKGTVDTVVTNNDIELESQMNLRTHPNQVNVTSEWVVGTENADV